MNELYIDPVFRELTTEMMKLDADISKRDLIRLVGYLSPDISSIVREEEIPSDGLGDYIIKELSAMNAVMKSQRIIESPSSYQERLGKLGEILSRTHEISSDSHRPKSSKELEKGKKSKSILNFIYPLSLGELVGIFGFTGTGKTTLSLSLIRTLSADDVRTLYVSVADWSETTLRRKIDQAERFPEFYVLVTPSYSISHLRDDIDYVNPSCVILDSMTNLETPPYPVDKRYLQLGWVSENLKRVALESKILLIATHQLGRMSTFPTQDDIQDSHSHILSSFDVVLGLGWSEDGLRSFITTLKVRHHELRRPAEIKIDFRQLRYKIL